MFQAKGTDAEVRLAGGWAGGSMPHRLAKDFRSEHSVREDFALTSFRAPGTEDPYAIPPGGTGRRRSSAG
jgi:hypothetical protein